MHGLQSSRIFWQTLLNFKIKGVYNIKLYWIEVLTRSFRISSNQRYFFLMWKWIEKKPITCQTAFQYFGLELIYFFNKLTCIEWCFRHALIINRLETSTAKKISKLTIKVLKLLWLVMGFYFLNFNVPVHCCFTAEYMLGNSR